MLNLRKDDVLKRRVYQKESYEKRIQAKIDRKARKEKYLEDFETEKSQAEEKEMEFNIEEFNEKFILESPPIDVTNNNNNNTKINKNSCLKP